ncbi:MAG: preprotein translocase subunit SecG [Thermodesulfovibrionales bacterium]|nr:preprotein translocase subunit SecG [Thermodesulfovibrionales bacterium]
MATFLLVVHIFVSFSLIFIVLIQGGKGAEMGAAFGGGSSQTVFGGRGATSFLSRITTYVAVLFMLTSLLLAITASKGGSGSVVKPTSAPATQGEIPTGQSAVPPAGTGSPVPQAGAPAQATGSPVPPAQSPAGQ